MTNASTAPSSADRELTITRVFDAPPALVFRAWIDPDQVARWWGPRGFSAPSVTLDARPGGAWRTCIRAEADGAEYWSRGEYREIVEPERLVFTFAWEEPEGIPGEEMLVTVTFAEHGSTTLMTFHQAVFTSAKDRDDQQDGWSECFDHLAAHLART